MGKVFRRFATCFTLSLCVSIAAINAQILQDTASLNLVKKGIDSVYNTISLMLMKLSERSASFIRNIPL